MSDPWRYAGGYFDGETHFTKFGARYDAQDLGRWTQQDPLPGTAADCRSLDRYVYAQDDPTTFVDPSGESCTPGGYISSWFTMLGTGILFVTSLFGGEVVPPAVVGSAILYETATWEWWNYVTTC